MRWTLSPRNCFIYSVCSLFCGINRLDRPTAEVTIVSYPVPADFSVIGRWVAILLRCSRWGRLPSVFLIPRLVRLGRLHLAVLPCFPIATPLVGGRTCYRGASLSLRNNTPRNLSPGVFIRRCWCFFALFVLSLFVLSSFVFSETRATRAYCLYVPPRGACPL